jgi:uncharacterized repeat protein (TIGR01451 family)
MARTIRIALVGLIVGGLALAEGLGTPALATNNVLRIDPTSTVVSPSSGAFNIQVRVDNVTTNNCTLGGQTQQCGLGSYTVALDFDPTIIQCEDLDSITPGCQSMTNGPFLTSTGRVLLMCSYTSGNDPANGHIRYTCLTGPTDPATQLPFGPVGSGLLATARFRPTGPASPTPSPLDLDQSILSDITGANPGAYPICAPSFTPCATQNGTATVNYSADLSLSKSGPSSVVAPGNASYTVTATNNGPDQAASVTVVDTLPSGTGFVSSSSGCAYDGESGTVTCDLGSMNASQQKSVNVTISVPASLAGASIVNGADVSTTATDTVSSNNHAQATTQVSASNISVTKTAPRDAPLGAAGQYVIGVSSSGPSTAAAVVVTDTLWRTVPAPYYYGATYVSANTTLGTCSYNGSTKTVTCNLGDMAVGASATITINVTFPNGTEPNFPHPDISHPTATYVGNTATATWTATPMGNRSSPTKWTFVALPDADGDGCHDYQELGSNLLKGGGRDPNNAYDFYDVPTPAIHSAGSAAAKDYAVTGLDLSALLSYGGNPAWYNEDVDHNGVPDGQEYDHRKASGFGPDGYISGLDMSRMLYEGGASCVAPY